MSKIIIKIDTKSCELMWKVLLDCYHNKGEEQHFRDKCYKYHEFFMNLASLGCVDQLELDLEIKKDEEIMDFMIAFKTSRGIEVMKNV